MSNPEVGIILPVFNGEKTLSRAINSVLSQTNSHWHLYIINDGSNDATTEILNKYKGLDKITVINNNVNIGVAESRNVGIKSCQQDIICFLDCDDEWMPEKIEIQKKYLSDKNKIICSNYYYIHERKYNQISHNTQSVSLNDFLLKKYRVCFSSIMIKLDGEKIFFDNIGHEDFLFLFRSIKNKGPIIITPHLLVKYHVMNSSLSSKKFKTLKWQFNNLMKIFPHSPIKIIFYMIHYIYRGVIFNRKYQ